MNPYHLEETDASDKEITLQALYMDFCRMEDKIYFTYGVELEDAKQSEALLKALEKIDQDYETNFTLDMDILGGSPQYEKIMIEQVDYEDEEMKENIN